MSREKEQTTLKQQTALPVTILSGYEHSEGNRFEEARQQIEKAGFYLQSLFTLIKLSSVAVQTMGKTNIDEHLETLMNVSEIGYGIADSIFCATTAFNELEGDIEESNRILTAGAAEEMKPDTAGAAILANKLSAVLNDESLPAEMFNSLMQAVNDLTNEADKSVLDKLETSPEYLTAVFSAHLKRE